MANGHGYQFDANVNLCYSSNLILTLTKKCGPVRAHERELNHLDKMRWMN